MLFRSGNFINNSGASALIASGSNGRWLVYSNPPTNNTFGGLNSANLALWGVTYSSYAPSAVTQAGNRYLFAGTQSLTVTADSVSKTYGNTLNGTDLLGVSSGLGGVSVYTLPNLSDIFSTVPTVTSGGLAATATVLGGPYAINVAAGTANSGYVVSYATPGSITVQPKSLTVTGTVVASKVYDGTLSAVLSGGLLNGVVNGDSVTLL